MATGNMFGVKLCGGCNDMCRSSNNWLLKNKNDTHRKQPKKRKIISIKERGYSNLVLTF